MRSSLSHLNGCSYAIASAQPVGNLTSLNDLNKATVMLPQQPPHRATELLRVRFYRASFDNTKNGQPTSPPIGNWLQSAAALPFNGQPSRYHEIGNGRRVYTVVDREQSPILFRINRTTYQGVPPAELLGNIGTNYLAQGQGLMDTWYSTVFDHTISGGQAAVVAIATKGNISPNVMLRDYIQNKFPNDSATLKIVQLAHKDILNRIASMGDGTLFEIGVRPAFVEAIRAVDSSLADAFQASQSAYAQKELTQIIRPSNTGRFGLRERFQDVINFVLSSEQNRTSVTKLRLGGLFGASNRTTIINLLSNDLSVDVEVPYTDQTFAILDSNAVYTEVQNAYALLAGAINEATEVSAWQRPETGTRNISSGSTPRQLPLSL